MLLEALKQPSVVFYKVENLYTFSSSDEDSTDRNKTENINQEECDVMLICTVFELILVSCILVTV